MVNIKYNGRTANSLIQYMFGRIISEEKDLQYLSYNGIHSECFDTDFKSGKVITLPVKTITDENTLEEILNDNDLCSYYISGYFQQARYYEPYREQIKKWIRFKNPIDFIPSNDSIFCHVRRSDMGISQNLGFVDLSFYTNILDSLKFDKLYLFGGNSCNDPNFKCIDDKVKKTFEKYNPIYTNTHPITEFQMMMRFRRGFLSTSTFSWLASFLSDYNEEIYFPITNGGYWDINNKLINLRLNDPRYIYIQNVPVEKW